MCTINTCIFVSLCVWTRFIYPCGALSFYLRTNSWKLWKASCNQFLFSILCVFPCFSCRSRIAVPVNDKLLWHRPRLAGLEASSVTNLRHITTVLGWTWQKRRDSDWSWTSGRAVDCPVILLSWGSQVKKFDFRHLFSRGFQRRFQ